MHPQRRRHFIIGSLAGGLLLAGCGDKESKEAPAAGETAAGSAEVAEAVVPSVSPEERAAKLGFVAHLPAETETAVVLYGLRDLTQKFRDLELVRLIEEQGGEEVAELNQDSESALKYLGDEVFFASAGTPWAAKSESVATLRDNIYYHALRAWVDFLAMQAGAGESADFSEYGPMVARRVLTAERALLPVLEDLEIPGLLMGSRIPDEARRAEAVEAMNQVRQGMLMMGGVTEEVAFERAGTAFTGTRLVGEKMAAMAETYRPMLEEFVGTDTTTRLIDAIKTKNVVVASATLDEYVIFFLGGSEEECQLAESPEQSLAAKSAIQFVDPFLDKEIIGLIHAEAESAEQLLHRGSVRIGTIAAGIRDGLADANSLGETGDVQALLDLLGEREAAIYDLYRFQDGNAVAYLEDGVKLECFGGSNYPYIDFSKTHRFAGMGEGEDVAVFLNSVGNEEFSRRVLSFVGALFHTAYAVVQEVAARPELADELGADFAEFQAMHALFEQQLRGEVERLWEALAVDFEEAAGAESALVIDLAGTMPPVPGLDPALIEEGRAPRIAYVRPVEDRAKLAESWKKIHSAGQNLARVASQMSGSEIPMLQPMSSSQNDLTTWFFAMPFFTDDFSMSVTVSDELFVASTSKTHALQLAEKAGQGPERSGSYGWIDLDRVRGFARDWVALLDQHADPSFAETKAEIVRALDSTEELQGLRWHIREENGSVRTSVHLQMDFAE